jgi:hypothetical protein
MAISLTPDQEAIVKEAVASGLARSAEDFVSMALKHMHNELVFDLEDRLGIGFDEINAEIDKGLNEPATIWEGAEAFHTRMLESRKAK